MARETALIVGVGPKLGASLARLFAAEGMALGLAARNVTKIEHLAKETGAKAYPCDASDPDQVEALFDAFSSDNGAPDVVVYNPSARARGPVTELSPDDVRAAIMTTSFGGFLVGQQAARCMLEKGSGSILFTGASASIKGYANSSSFAMGKFGLRGLAQSMARELAPKNIHVAHFVIDGGIGDENDPRGEGKGPDALLHPDAIAQTYLHTHRQHRSAWTWEVELRPWVENF